MQGAPSRGVALASAAAAVAVAAAVVLCVPVGLAEVGVQQRREALFCTTEVTSVALAFSAASWWRGR